MIIEIDNILVSGELLQNNFVCNLNKCKGACCVKGDAGAPLTMEEINVLEEELEQIHPFMRDEGKAAVAQSGVFYMDTFNEPVTTLVHGAECAFANFDAKGVVQCSIEMAHKAGKTTLKKPLSCHLYPIRVSKTKTHKILNYDKWDICAAACTLGDELQVKTFRFLKEPIMRAFGEQFYAEMELVANEIESSENR